MRVVVTGAAGFIGSHLVDALLADGHQVVGIDCFTDYYGRSDKEANLVSARAHDRFELVEADLRTDPLEAVLDGADVVVNQAATPGLVLSWDDFERYQSCNLGAVHRLVRASLAVGVGHLVQASTSSVYGAHATTVEDGPTCPVSPYGVTKLAAEHLVRAHGDAAGLQYTILRYFSVYGPRQRPDMAYRVFAERLLAGEPIVVYGDGRQSRSNTYVADAVSATTAAIGRVPDGSVFNVGGGEEIELLQAAALLADLLGVEAVIEHRPARVGDQRRTVADVRRARSELGWAPTTRVREGLSAEVAWLRARR